MPTQQAQIRCLRIGGVIGAISLRESIMRAIIMVCVAAALLSSATLSAEGDVRQPASTSQLLPSIPVVSIACQGQPSNAVRLNALAGEPVETAPAGKLPLELPKLDDGITPPEVPNKGESVGRFLTPDGRFDLEEVRRSGYEGSLDLDGFDIDRDPVTGEPVLTAKLQGSPQDDPDDVYWDDSISPSVPGVAGPVYVAIVYDGNLVVGGSFRVAGDVIASNIASWNGSTWRPLGSGTDGTIRALTVYDGNLIAGGPFTTAGGKVSGYLASWTKCCNGTRGNVNFDAAGAVTVADITFLINHVFRGGPQPDCFEDADVTADGKLAVADITFLIAYVFRGGPAPAACPGDAAPGGVYCSNCVNSSYGMTGQVSVSRTPRSLMPVATRKAHVWSSQSKTAM